MKISKFIKEVTKDYAPLFKEVKRKEKEGIDVTEEERNELFELATKLDLYKILKSSFMEAIVKDEKGKVTEYFVKNNLITYRKEKATDKNGNEVEVDVVNEPMDARIDLLPEEFTQPIIEKMVTAHKANVDGYTKSGNTELLKKEQFELKVLEGFLPKEATEEDIVEYLNQYYPNGTDRKSMGLVIREVKGAFKRADGKLVAACVNKIITG